jgi:ribokinase
MSQVRPRVCVVGSTNIDLTFRTDRLPRPGETLTGHSFQLGFGGKGANQAVMAARLGAAVTMVGRVGNDPFAQEALGNLRSQGIEVHHVRRDAERPTGVAAIIVDEQARNCILLVAGANLGLSPDDVRQAADAIRSADVVLGQLEVPPEATAEAFRLARSAGVRTVLNPAPAVALPAELLALADLCVPNETEAELLTGRPVTTLAEAEAAARTLRERGPRAVLLTLAERGVMLMGDGPVEVIPGREVTAVDSSGAGDAFIGSLAVFLAEGMTLPEAARRANAAAALSVTRSGTQASFPTRAEVEAFDRPSGSAEIPAES